MTPLISLLLVAIFSVASAEQACNNSPRLCSTPYDQVTHLGAHDSPFLRDGSTGFSSFGNQFFNTTVQLDAGVRLLSAQVHVVSNPETKARELHLCHSSCALFDAGSVHEWLWEIQVWMDANADEIVTLVLVNTHSVDAQELQAEYSKADIAHYGHVPEMIDEASLLSSEKEETWPTLGQMIVKGERLVSFINPLTPDKENAPYLLDEFEFVWENDYAVTEPDQFNCVPDRPSNVTTIDEMRDSDKLFLMNHMLYWQQAFGIQTPDARHVNDTSSWDGAGGLGTHMIQCGKEVARQPTFVLVDFFNVRPVIEVIDIFNDVKDPVGRKEMTPDVMEGGPNMKLLSGAGRHAGSPTLALVVAFTAAIIIDSGY